MKTILFLMLLPVLSYGQAKDSSVILAGKQFELFYKKHQLGSGCIVGGGALIVAQSITKSSSPALTYVGCGIALIGTVIELSSWEHCKAAAWYLQGDKVIIPINKKKAPYKHQREDLYHPIEK